MHKPATNQTLLLCNIHLSYQNAFTGGTRKKQTNIPSILHNKQLPPFTLWLQLCIWPCYYIWRRTSHCFPPSCCLWRIHSRHRTFVFIYNNEPTMSYAISWLIPAVLHCFYEITVEVIYRYTICLFFILILNLICGEKTPPSIYRILSKLS